MLQEKNIVLDEITNIKIDRKSEYANLAKTFPITTGIVKSFNYLPKGYTYMAVDGTDRCMKALENIESLSNVFLEISLCQDSCVNGPCSLKTKGGSLKATADVREYTKREIAELPEEIEEKPLEVDLSFCYPRIRNNSKPATDHEIENILRMTGKMKPEDELNCGACGYSTCREKAWAVINGYADIEICLPYMRSRAESMSYEIIHNSPEGIVVLDKDLNILDINNKAMELLGVDDLVVKGRPSTDFFSPVEFLTALNEQRNVECQKIFVPATRRYVDLSVNILKDHKILFGILKDVTEGVNYDHELTKMKLETLATTDEMIKKQMRVAQEIASLLGETTAETKVALLKLKKTLQEEKKEGL